MTKDEVKELQYWYGDATGHRPKEEGHSMRGRDESYDFEKFQVERRI